jgi:hypothetical protein
MFHPCLSGLLGAALALMPPLAAAQAFANKPLRLVVGFLPGGAPDILARRFADKAQLGQPVVVGNRTSGPRCRSARRAWAWRSGSPRPRSWRACGPRRS